MMKIKLLRIFTKIKHFFKDNKEYFQKVITASIIAGFILAMFISLVVPSSAAGDPAEDDQVVIPAGTYRWNDSVSDSGLEDYYFSADVRVHCDFVFSESSLEPASYEVSYNQFGVDNDTVYYNNDPVDESVIFGFINLGGSWNGLADAFASSGIANADLARGYAQTFTLVSDISVSSAYSQWFFENTEDVMYLIEAGYYKSNSWTTSGFPISYDSIKIRYYDPFSEAYVNSEGMAFYIDRDIVTIDYGANSVYTDGWNSDAFKNIQVTEDVYVDEDFYTVFNDVFDLSSSSSNDYDIGYSEGYDDGFQDGRESGLTQGYLSGYDEGYSAGIAEGSGNFFADIIGGVVESLDRFVLFGEYSLLDLFTTLLGGMALVWILKLLAGG